MGYYSDIARACDAILKKHMAKSGDCPLRRSGFSSAEEVRRELAKQNITKKTQADLRAEMREQMNRGETRYDRERFEKILDDFIAAGKNPVRVVDLAQAYYPHFEIAYGPERKAAATKVYGWMRRSKRFEKVGSALYFIHGKPTEKK